ncbi:hypothetical protein GCK32_010724 [Trichostrongylus colubriformis]|uniref:Uncharacterized protein n=1 Tax=Trichostrongylus colubriformis TaxID=6319 RepID=A0AAN8J211_TRICO
MNKFEKENYSRGRHGENHTALLRADIPHKIAISTNRTFRVRATRQLVHCLINFRPEFNLFESNGFPGPPKQERTLD